MIENPAFAEHYKIGMTVDLKSRLEAYQTYDPYRQFSVVKYDFVLNRRSVEELVLFNPMILREEGEWVKRENAKEVFEKIVFG